MRGLAALTLTAFPVFLNPIAAQATLDPDRASFVVSGIRVEGLQRVSEGTLFNYLPANIGDTLSAARVREI